MSIELRSTAFEEGQRTLDKKLDLAPAADKPALLAAIQGHVLAEGRLTGTYSR